MRELDRGRHAVRGGSVRVGFRYAKDGLAADTEERGRLDSARAIEDALAPDRIVDFDHKGSGQFGPVRDERTVRLELTWDLLRVTFF